MKTMNRVSTVAIGAAAVALMAAGVAGAATVHGSGTAGTITPTTDYTVCGTVYGGTSSPSTGNNPMPAGAAAVEGVTVTGKLFNVFGTQVGSAFSTVSAADGTYCITGTSSMASTVIALGKVVLTATPTSITPPTPAVSVALPYGGTIRAGEFLNHLSGTNSAANVNIAYN
ncbi:MAG: hypothetical protein U5O16_39055 [Rhodococcus sp. (in: high G+C Gram-positive bacteria)]|uniref:hypothetical protein n=1 Tax=Rhodococcus sp. TaxID=1831 RepID=UPI002AD9073F|nr:hypothetical protein [Rhodococcus sp. (in: high G+C Gram-positive bacteria)]